ncbi:MAG: hypothetical protein K1X68_04510 [Saprospiraceae bacterium]|nr:hypothetical protein [Saprospiraceae bacterium]HMW39632.1 hypothetical protein [Saprospiraceae bacterium]HMX88731.1 hypothetical protein [Saprospiraceae bacterium]HMZ38863.1 hypothetical protein [Saprospiraceae bacterium]HNB31977.1 hypothetical protein [Saprospiraceae bacterium]
MNNSEQFDALEERIIDYLEGSMDKASREALEAEVSKGGEAAQMMREYQEVWTGVNIWGEDEIRRQIKLIHDKNLTFNSGRNALKIAPYSWLKYAAVLTALMLASYLIYWLNKPDKADLAGLFQKYYSPQVELTEDLMVKYRSAMLLPGDHPSDSVLLGMEKYRLGDYKSSLEILINVQDTGIVGSLARFYRGLDHMGLGNYNEAWNLLSPLCQQSDLEFCHTACWIAILASLQLHIPSNLVIPKLNQLIEAEGLYRIPANELLNALQ